jgi:phasin family protein
MAKKPTGAPEFPFAFPQFDLNSFTSRLKDAGLDAEAMMLSHQKNIAAITEANKKAAEGYMALFSRQKEIFEETVAAVQDAVKDLMDANKGKDLTKTQTALVEKTIGKALTNMKELAELAMSANSSAYKVMQKRTQESLGEVQELTAKLLAKK